MNRQPVELVLPRLAQRLNRQLRRHRAGQMDENQFSAKFEDLLEQQYTWLLDQGIADVDAAIAVHSAVLVLSTPGLRAEASEKGLPLEIVEFRAVRAAAEDICENYGLTPAQAVRRISALVSLHTD
jgi:antitoxin component of RelBE/YafQ-DinJ toxin-antitoxin module